MGGFSPSSTKILQRTLLAAVPALLIFSLLPSGFAQSTGKKPSKGPRAVAVVEWTPSGPHLIPVSILVDGKFYDAGLYLANPVPMALEPGNIYEIQKSGDPSRPLHDQFGDGASSRATPSMELARSRRRQMSRPPIKEPQPRKPQPPQELPRVRVPKIAALRACAEPVDSGGRSGSPGGSPTSGPSIPQPPSQPPSSTPDSTGGDDDPDRPTMKRSEPPPAAPTAAPASTTASTTPPAGRSRTVRCLSVDLKDSRRRASLVRLCTEVAGRRHRPVASHISRLPTIAFEVAVSDANSSQPHPFKWIGKPDYEQRDQEATRQLALQAVRDYAAKHPGLRPSSVTDDLAGSRLRSGLQQQPDLRSDRDGSASFRTDAEVTNAEAKGRCSAGAPSDRTEE